jgi:hypothetical protein
VFVNNDGQVDAWIQVMGWDLIHNTPRPIRNLCDIDYIFSTIVPDGNPLLRDKQVKSNSSPTVVWERCTGWGEEENDTELPDTCIIDAHDKSHTISSDDDGKPTQTDTLGWDLGSAWEETNNNNDNNYEEEEWSTKDDDDAHIENYTNNTEEMNVDDDENDERYFPDYDKVSNNEEALDGFYSLDWPKLFHRLDAKKPYWMIHKSYTDMN